MLFVLLVIGGLGTAVWYISQPQDLSDIEEYSKEGTESLEGTSSRDIEEVLRKSLEGGHSVSISEKEINLFLARELKSKQEGYVGQWVKIKQVLVRLEENVAELIVVREILGYETTVSMFVQVSKVEDKKGMNTQANFHGGKFHENLPLINRGGRFGSLTVPQGFLILVMPEFRKIGDLFKTEIDLGFEKMARFKIEEGKLVLDPKKHTKEGEQGDSF